MSSVIVEENFLSPTLFSECQELAYSIPYLKESKFRSSYGWDKDLSRQSSPVLVYDLGSENKELFDKIRKEIRSKTELFLEDILIQYWSKLSYLDWHSDAVYSSALTVYLNKEWKPQWGGYFLYRDKKEIKGIIPKPNLAIAQPGGVPHCVTTVNIDSDIRISLQAFLSNNSKLL